MIDRHQDFFKWHRKNLVEFLNFILFYHKEELMKFLREYDEMLSGN